MYAIELMMEEHKNIKRMLKIVRKVCFNILEGEEVNYEEFEKITSFITNYSDNHHHKKEEIYLFNRMVEEIGERAVKVINHGMLVEHDLGRLYISNLRHALEEYKNGNKEAKLDIIANSISYTDLLNRHIEKEDNVIYNFAKRSLKEETFEVINKECKEFEKYYKNIEKENISILDALEEKYCK